MLDTLNDGCPTTLSAISCSLLLDIVKDRCLTTISSCRGWAGVPQTSLRYCSPEMLAAVEAMSFHPDPYSKHVDFLKHDVWGLGCLLVYLLTGYDLFTDRPRNQQSSERLTQDGMTHEREPAQLVAAQSPSEAEHASVSWGTQQGSSMPASAPDQQTHSVRSVKTHQAQQLQVSVKHVGTKQTHTVPAADGSQQVQQQPESGSRYTYGQCPQECVAQPEEAAGVQHVGSAPQVDEVSKAAWTTLKREKIEAALTEFRCVRGGHQAWVSIWTTICTSVRTYIPDMFIVDAVLVVLSSIC